MNFKLPDLPYSRDFLEPVISAQTIDYHYGKHHKAYVDNLNKLTQGTDWKNASLEELIRTTEGGIFNNAAQVWNHAFYWHCMTMDSPGITSNDFKKALDDAFGSIESFKNHYIQAAVTLFGSGWAWLVLSPDGKLSIMQGPNAWNPIRENLIPLLTCDVWEHAYYLDYQNKRPDYTGSFWGLIDWKKVEARFHEKSHLLDCC